MKFQPYFKYFLLAVLLYFPLFGYLDYLPIRIWDEARLAENAREMNDNGNLVVTYFDRVPDMWNTKPPLMIWMQVLCIKLLGFNELAIRLPSAISGLFICLIMLLLSQKYLRSPLIGILGVLALVTMDGYISLHGTRTGDYDALLGLLMLVYALAFFAFAESGKTKYLYLFFTCLILAVLTKGIAGLLFTPGLMIYSLIRKNTFSLLRNKHFYIGVCAFLIISPGYYLLREHYNPGFLQAVWDNEIGGRYLKAQENNTGAFWYYYHRFVDQSMSFWYLLVIFGFFAGLASLEKRIRTLTIFSGIILITFFLIISLAKTKLPWYEFPMYPLLAMLAGIAIHHFFLLIRKGNSAYRRWLSIVFLIAVFIGPYHNIFKKIYLPEETPSDKPDFNTIYFLRDAVRGKHDVNDHYIAMFGYVTQLQFYVYQLQDKGVNIDLKWHENFKENDRVIVGEKRMQEYLRTHYPCSETLLENNIIIFKIRGSHRKN